MRPSNGIFPDRKQAAWCQDMADEINAATSKKQVGDGYLLVVDKKQSGVNGGNAQPGSWRDRDLNTVVSETGGFISLASGKLTIKPGVYEFMVSVPGYKVGRHQARLISTKGDWSALGTVESSDADAPGVTNSIVIGRIDIKNIAVFKVQQIVEKEAEGTGQGIAGGFGDEIYTVAEFRRIGG